MLHLGNPSQVDPVYHARRENGFVETGYILNVFLSKICVKVLAISTVIRYSPQKGNPMFFLQYLEA